MKITKRKHKLGSLFCKHNYELISHDVAKEPAYRWETPMHKWTYMCKKCGSFITYKDE